MALILAIISMGLIVISKSPEQYIPNEIPKISISTGGQSLQYVSAENKWNGSMINRKDTFKMIVDKFSTAEIPYIKLDEKVQIDFGKNPPDKVKITDSLINKFGDLALAEKVAVTSITPHISGSRYIFDIKKTMASRLNSNSDSYQPGNTWHGYRIICSWGYNECEYAFIIRTDAGAGMIMPENQESKMEVKITSLLEKYHPTMSSVPGLPLNATFVEKEGKAYKLQWQIADGTLLSWDQKTGKIENIKTAGIDETTGAAGTTGIDETIGAAGTTGTTETTETAVCRRCSLGACCLAGQHLPLRFPRPLRRPRGWRSLKMITKHVPR